MLKFVHSLRVQLASLGIMACVVALLFGVYRFFDYSLPMNTHDFRGAAEASVGDQPTALYDWSLQLYREQRYKLAIEVATEAQNQLTKKTGAVPPDQLDLAAKIQMMIGVCNEYEKQYRLAISAYEESLRADPDNLAAKYNLERLKSKFPDMGGGRGQPQDPGGSSSQDKKKGV
jgi:hypothetical protein